MFFNGRYAEFTKHIQAEQENAHLLCQSLQVYFVHPLSRKEGNHGGPPPRVKNLVCYKDVQLSRGPRHLEEGDRVISAKRLKGPSSRIWSDALEPEETNGKVEAGSPGNEIRMPPGPGDVRMYSGRRG